MSDALTFLLDTCWEALSDGLSRPEAPGRLPTLATVSPEGLPQARTVVLRAADRTDAWAEVHTDAASAKISELRANPHAALCIWDAPRNLQIRMAAEVLVLSGSDAADRWAKVPLSARGGYGAIPPSGTPIAAATHYQRTANAEGHAVLRLNITALDLLTLGPPQARATYRADDNWRGQWLSP